MKRTALAALTGNYADKEAAQGGIANEFRGFYRQSYPDELIRHGDAIDRAVASIQAAHQRNIHYDMNVEWDVYPNHIGHKAGGGCFRCHNQQLTDDEGRTISADCTLCHSFLSYESGELFEFVKAPTKKDPDYQLHRYLQGELRRHLNRGPSATRLQAASGGAALP